MHRNYMLFIVLNILVLSSVAMQKAHKKNDFEIPSHIRQGIVSSKTAFTCTIANQTGKSIGYAFGAKVETLFESDVFQKSIKNGVDKVFNFEATTYLTLQLSAQEYTGEYLIIRTNECNTPSQNFLLKKVITRVDSSKLMPHLKFIQSAQEHLAQSGYGLKVACDYEIAKENLARYKAGALASAMIILGPQGKIQTNVTFK